MVSHLGCEWPKFSRVTSDLGASIFDAQLELPKEPDFHELGSLHFQEIICKVSQVGHPKSEAPKIVTFENVGH